MNKGHLAPFGLNKRRQHLPQCSQFSMGHTEEHQLENMTLPSFLKSLFKCSTAKDSYRYRICVCTKESDSWKHSHIPPKLPLSEWHNPLILHIKNMNERRRKSRLVKELKSVCMIYDTVIWKQWFSGANYELQVPWAQTTFPQSPVMIEHPWLDNKTKNKLKINVQTRFSLKIPSGWDQNIKQIFGM